MHTFGDFFIKYIIFETDKSKLAMSLKYVDVRHPLKGGYRNVYFYRYVFQKKTLGIFSMWLEENWLSLKHTSDYMIYPLPFPIFLNVLNIF